MTEDNPELLVCTVCKAEDERKHQEQLKEMADFCRTLEEAVKERKPLTLFGIDYDPVDD